MADFKEPSFSTPVQVRPLERRLAGSSTVCGVGSCFAENILRRLFELGVEGAQNPNGIVYNAVSMRDSILRAICGTPHSGDEFFQHDGMWRSWAHHGSFSSADLETAIGRADSSMLAFREKLSTAGMLVMTPASSVVYELQPEGRVVANCHKVPNNRFSRRILSVEENYAALRETVSGVLEFNPGCLVMLTLSPVRHYPGDLVLNSRSKASLLSATHMCVEEFQGRAFYFPSFEIMFDELRDYRFYKDDMLHPSELAESVIFGRFLRACFDDGAMDFISRAASELRASAHRPRS